MSHFSKIYVSFLVGAILAVLGTGLTMIIFPLKYGASATILVMPHAAPSLDPYTTSKAAERIGQNLAEVIHSSQFFGRVLAASTGIDQTYFPTDELQRRQLWNNSVDASVIYNTGILQITAYHPDKIQAVGLAGAVAGVLTASGNDFALSGADYRLLDTPVASRFPAKPNLAVVAVVGFLGGFLLSLAYFSWKRRPAY